MGSAGVAGGAVGEAGSASDQTATPPEGPSPSPAEPGVAPDAPAAETSVPEDVPDPAVPPYHVSEVTVEGTVNGERADLTIRIDVEINRSSGWYDVPLRMGQAHIYRQKASGTGSQLPGQPALQDDGLHWRFHGRGKHTLEFQVGVPVRTTPAGRHLQLSLPVMPPLFEAFVKLKLEGGHFAVRSPNRETALRIAPDAAANATFVEGGVSGGRLELTWQDRAQKTPADGAASTTYTLKRRAALWELEAQQAIVRMESQAREFLVHLPENFTVTEVSGTALESWTAVADKPGWLRLRLTEDASGRIDLHWRLERPFPVSGGTVNLSGLELEGVRTHDGRLRILPVPGFQLLPGDETPRYLERVDDSSTASGEAGAWLAYSFSAGDWKMPLVVRQIEPLFACKPRLDVLIRGEGASLTASFELREEAGDVQKLAVDVAAIEAAGWVLTTGMRPGASPVTISRSGSILTLEWPPGLGAKKQGDLRFERPLDGPEFAFDVPLPRPRATWLESAVVAIRAADELRIDIAGAIATADPKLDASTPLEASRTIGAFQPAGPESPISIHGSVEARTISATANIVVEAVESRRITVEQQIGLDVRYGRIDSLRLLIPEGFPVTPGAERLAFQVWIDGREASDLEWTSGAIRVPFPRPRLGLIRVAVRYALPRQGDQSRLSLPVIVTPDVKFHEVTLEASLGAGINVDTAASLWREVTTTSDRRRWIAEVDADSADLVVEKERRTANERAVISAGFIRTEAAAGGVQRTVALYNISRSGELLSFTLPPSATLNEVTLNGRMAEALRGTDPAEENQWTIRMPAGSATASNKLEVAYDVVPATARGAVGRLKVALPQFAKETLIEEIVWKLTLPESDVLMASPPGMTRLFEWQRRGVFWRRILSPAYAQALRAADFTVPDDEAKSEGYAFRQIGGPSSLTVWTLDRSLLILIGAGVTLILGFLFWSVRRLQNVLTFLLLAFLICLAGLWFSEAIQVLLQPALVGCVMAVAATAIDGRTRRRIRGRIATRESSIYPAVRGSAAKANDPLRSTILRPAGSDHGATG